MKKLLTILCFLIFISACSANNSVADKSEEKETNETVEKTEDLNAAKASPFVDLAGINSDNFAEYVNGKYYACKTYDESNNYNGNFAKEFCVFKFNIDGDNLLFEKYDYTNLKPVVFELDKNSEFAEFSRRYGQFTYHYHYLRSYNDDSAVNNIAVYLPTDAESDEVGGLYFRYENDILSFNFKTLSFKGKLYNDIEQILENEAIGKITIETDSINVRSWTSTNFDKVGTVSNGETYDVYEINDVNNTGFTWYQIGCNRWVADDGTWLTYTPKQ